MALANYSDLQAAVASWAHRTDLGSSIPDFIALAEARMSSDLSSKSLELVQTATITAGVATLPDNVIETLRLRVVGATKPDVEITSSERIESLRQAAYAGSSIYASLIGREVHLYPTTTGSLQVVAKCRVPALSTNSTNWVLTTFPNVYLFGALVELADHTADDSGRIRWATRYAEAVAQANAALTYRGQRSASVVHGVR